MSFVKGKLYIFLEDGEDLPTEDTYKTFVRNILIKKDNFGYYTIFDDIKYVPITSGTIALSLGDEIINVLSAELHIEQQKCFKLFINGYIGLLLSKEKNLYNFKELDH